MLIIFFSACFTSCRTKTVSSFENSSGVKDINLTPEKIQDLVILGKIWGYLKYYHPTVTSGKYNWDHELFKILPKIIESKDKIERNELFTFWIDNLGEPAMEIPKKNINNSLERMIDSLRIEEEDRQFKRYDSSTVKMHPDLNWLNDTSVLGMKLSKQLTEIKSMKRKSNGYYVV